MALYATAGSKLFIGAALAEKSTDFISSDFTSQTWVEIKNIESLGTLGDTSQSINVTTVGDTRERVLKGVRSAGTMELVVALDYADAGQIAAIAAEKTPYSYAFKLEFNDKPSSGASPKNSTRQFVAKVMKAEEAYDGANSEMKMNISLSVNSNIVRTDASET
jgi:Phage tail tube protein, TTP